MRNFCESFAVRPLQVRPIVVFLNYYACCMILNIIFFHFHTLFYGYVSTSNGFAKLISATFADAMLPIYVCGIFSRLLG
jgi:hypothetical protein